MIGSETNWMQEIQNSNDLLRPLGLMMGPGREGLGRSGRPGTNMFIIDQMQAVWMAINNN